MAKLNTSFDATKHDTEQREFEDLPNGIYDLEIEASEIVETGPENDRTGLGIKYTSNVIEPKDLEGRKFFGFINVENKSTKAQEIGQRELASLCRGCGVSGVDDTEELHFKRYRVKIGMGKPSKKANADGTPQYPARAEIKRYYFPDEGNMPDTGLDDNQPVKAANDNRKPATNDNAAAGGEKKSRPW